jgi:hypothetical protein
MVHTAVPPGNLMPVGSGGGGGGMTSSLARPV